MSTLYECVIKFHGNLHARARTHTHTHTQNIFMFYIQNFIYI